MKDTGSNASHELRKESRQADAERDDVHGISNSDGAVEVESGAWAVLRLKTLTIAAGAQVHLRDRCCRAEWDTEHPLNDPVVQVVVRLVVRRILGRTNVRLTVVIYVVRQGAEVLEVAHGEVVDRMI